MQREESKHEELERQKLEREQMRLAITAYTGPDHRVSSRQVDKRPVRSR